MRELYEVQILRLLDVIVVDNYGRGAAAHLLAELCVVLLLDLEERVGLLRHLATAIICIL